MHVLIDILNINNSDFTGIAFIALIAEPSTVLLTTLLQRQQDKHHLYVTQIYH